MTDLRRQRKLASNTPPKPDSGRPGRPGLDPTPLLEAGGGVLWVPDWPRHARAIARLAKQGRLIRLMRGLYVATGTERLVEILIRAIQTAYPNAIFTGATAAWLHGWSTVKVTEVTATHSGASIRFPMVRLTRGRLPDTVWTERNGIRLLTPAMTAMDVAPQLGGKLIDDLIRRARDTHMVLANLRAALAATPGRVGNAIRHRLLERSTTEPFSEAERRLHELLEAAGITGWVANARQWIRGQVLRPDILFAEARLVVEVDGFAFHSSRKQFRSDRRRQNQLILDGCRVLRFTWDDITESPATVVAEIQEALFV